MERIIWLVLTSCPSPLEGSETRLQDRQEFHSHEHVAWVISPTVAVSDFAFQVGPTSGPMDRDFHCETQSLFAAVASFVTFAMMFVMPHFSYLVCCT